MSDRFIPSDISFSLEVFPPKTADGLDHLLAAVDAYVAIKPAAITVTFGAVGSDETTAHVRSVIRRIRQHTDVPVIAHVTCAGRSCAEVDAFVDDLVQDGVAHFVALRGDMLGHGAPYHPHPDGYAMTYDFVAALKRRHPAQQVYVAGYPEMHPESPSEAFDLDHLKRKVDAGADGVLTQFFFDPEVFLHWRDKVEKRGVHVPLVPGLMPILDFKRTCAMAQRCNAQIPDFLHTMFDGVAPESIDHKLLAMNVLSHQITRLIEHGVSHFHFYTMNETILTRHLCTWLRTGF
ncbi:MAG TPA: methylenetetrahydrofolate reductase [NAD(P)H] [Rhodospirillaceae bacterium]|nr:methylenetetrahydrofolate reductase [NAD(P)H] [Rhodospirillaceae bacterium]